LPNAPSKILTDANALIDDGIMQTLLGSQSFKLCHVQLSAQPKERKEKEVVYLGMHSYTAWPNWILTKGTDGCSVL
jgi:hypothetical protein